MLFKKWFIDNPDNKIWQSGTFSNFIENIISGDWGKSTCSGNNTESVYCIRGTDIPEICLGNKGNMPIRYILARNFMKKKLVAGDIVVEISGGSPTQSTGRAAMISSALLNRYDKDMICTNFCKALKPRKGYSMFLYYYWKWLYDRDVFFSYENGTTGIKNLDLISFINREPIIVPPQNLIEKFENLCQTISKINYLHGLENEYLSQIRDNLLVKLMSI